jgi:hypothetical protein
MQHLSCEACINCMPDGSAAVHAHAAAAALNLAAGHGLLTWWRWRNPAYRPASHCSIWHFHQLRWRSGRWPAREDLFRLPAVRLQRDHRHLADRFHLRKVARLETAVRRANAAGKPEREEGRKQSCCASHLQKVSTRLLSAAPDQNQKQLAQVPRRNPP